MIPALITVVIIGAVVWGIWARRKSREREQERGREVLLQLAPRLAIPERLTGNSLRFDRRGFPAAVSVHAGTRLNVEASFQLTGDEKGWLTVSSLGLKRAFLDQLGLKDYQVGDAEFDDRFEVWGLDEVLVRNRLQPTLRGMLLQSDRRWDFMLRLTPEQLSMRAHVDPLDRFQVESLAGIAFQILDILDLRSAADFVLAKVQEKLTDETRCPVCGAPLSRGSVVRCSQCRAAHHADCWQFNGLCATFACGSQLHVR